MLKLLLMNGMDTGTFPVIMRHVQSMLVSTRDRNELQHSLVGEEPLAVLPVTKLMQGVKLVIIELVHGVLICAFAPKNIADIIIRVASGAFRHE